MTYCSIWGGGGGGEGEEEEVNPREKVWSVGFLHDLFLTHSD